MSNPIEVEEASGNVFADIGLLNPEERLAKADLAIRIDEAIRARRLTQSRAAHILGIDQPKISRLLRGQLSGFSTERLMHFLTLLGQDVENHGKARAAITSPRASSRPYDSLSVLSWKAPPLDHPVVSPWCPVGLRQARRAGFPA